jgi:hypothetical protein
LVDESEEIVEAKEKFEERGEDSGDSAGGVKTEWLLLVWAAIGGAESEDMAIGALCSACSDACPCIAPVPTVGEKFPLIGRELLLPRLLASLPRREFGVESKLDEEREAGQGDRKKLDKIRENVQRKTFAARDQKHETKNDETNVHKESVLRIV